MNIFDMMASLGLNSKGFMVGLDEAEAKGKSKSNSISSTFGKIASDVGKAIATAAGAAGSGVVAMTTAALNSYGDYEQLVGGVETLFKDSSDKVMEYANNAYMTAGLSANQYMETVTSFSASLLQSLSGDTESATEYANMAITDMSDNANKMGTSMESIQFAYQGFAKQNYTMLDNLKLGYGGTKEEMERLILDAEKLDTTFSAARDANGKLAMSYADVVDAIHVVQTNMGITGTTAKEASTTIQGSVNSMKSAWKNLVTGLGDSNADMSVLMDNLVVSVETVIGNIEPVMETLLINVSMALPEIVAKGLNMLTGMIPKIGPNLISGITNVIKSLSGAIPDIAKTLINMLPELLTQVIGSLGDILGSLLPSIASAVGQTLLNLPSIIVGTISGLKDGFVNMFKGIIEAADKALGPQIKEGAFANTEEGMQTGLQNAVENAVDNLKLSIATLTGDDGLVNAISNKKLNEGWFNQIVAEYDSFRQSVSQYTPEAIALQIQTKTAVVTGFLDQLYDIVDEDGNISSSDLGLAQALESAIESALGQDVLSIEKGALWTLIESDVAYADQYGHKYWTVEDWTDSVIERTGTEDTPEFRQMLNVIWDMYHNGEPITEKSVTSKLKELGYSDEEIKTIINYEILGLDDMEQAIADFDKIVNQQLSLAMIDAQIQRIVDLTTSSTEGVDLFGESWENMQNALSDSRGFDEWKVSSEAAMDALSGLKGLSDANVESLQAIALATWNANQEEKDRATTYEQLPAKIKAETEAKIANSTATKNAEAAAKMFLDAQVEVANSTENTSVLFEAQSSIIDLVKMGFADIGDSAVASALNLDDFDLALAGAGISLEELVAYDAPLKTMFDLLQEGMSPEQILQMTDYGAILETIASQLGITTDEVWALISGEKELQTANSTTKTSIEGVGTAAKNQNQPMEDFKTKFTETAAEIEAAAGTMSETVANEVDGIGTALDESTAPDSAATLVDGTEDEVDALDLGTPTDESLTDMKNKFDNFKDRMGTAAYGVAQKVTSRFDDMKTQVSTSVNNMVTNIMNAMNNAPAYQTALNLASNIYRGVDSYSSYWYPLGSSAGSGVVNGIYSKSSEAYRAGAELGRQVSSGFKDNLKISSPSRVMYENTGYVIDGIVNRIEADKDEVSQAMADLTGFSAIEGYTGNISVTPIKNESSDDNINKILAAINDIGIYLDGNELVGHVINNIDQGLDKISKNNRRGGVVYA